MAIELKIVDPPRVELSASGGEHLRFGMDEGMQYRDYDDLLNRPEINGVTLTGDKNPAELGVQGTDKLVQTVSASSAADEYPSARALWNQAAKYAKCKRFVGTSVPGGVFTLSSNNIADIYNAQTSGGQIVFIFDETQKITYRVNYCFIDHTDPAHERIVVYAVAEHVDTTQEPNYGISGEYQDALYIKAAATSQMLIPITRELANASDIPTRVSQLTNDAGYVNAAGAAAASPVQSVNGRTGAVSGLQEALTFDTTPTASSTNPVTSGGIYNALTEQTALVVNIPDTSDTSTITPSAQEVADAVAANRPVVLNFQDKTTAPCATQSGAMQGLNFHLLMGKLADMDENAGFVNSTGSLAIAQIGSTWIYYHVWTSTFAPGSTNISTFPNDVGYVDATGAASAAPVQSVNGQTGNVTGLQPAGNYAAAAAGDTTAAALATASIPFAQVDSTSTSTVFTATVPGITEYRDGVSFWLRNGKVTSASGFTVNINGLGAKKVFSNMAPTTRDTTLFNINYTMLFVYCEWLDDGDGGFLQYRGYDANTNTLGYQLRTNSYSLPMQSVTYRYRLFFRSADGSKFVPANNSTSTNATSSRTVNQTPIDPHGQIVYYGTTAAVTAGNRPSAANLWTQYIVTIGYSFNRTGAEQVMTPWTPVYIKAEPQTDGSAIIDADTPYVQALPTTADGKIYIYLGVAVERVASGVTHYDTLEIEMNHPIYHYYNGAIRLWTGPV